jgi:hypothetical protein
VVAKYPSTFIQAPIIFFWEGGVHVSSFSSRNKRNPGGKLTSSQPLPQNGKYEETNDRIEAKATAAPPVSEYVCTYTLSVSVSVCGMNYT